MSMYEGFDRMETRIREELGLDKGWVVEPAGAVRGNACSEVAIYPASGGYSSVPMDHLLADFPGTMEELRKVFHLDEKPET